MVEQVHYYINKAFDYEECGDIEAAILLCNKCIQAFPEYQNEIEFEIAKMNYRNGRREEALIQFLMLYQKSGDNEISDLVLKAYYDSRKQELDKRFRENSRQLANYAHFFGSIHSVEIRYCPILLGEKFIWYFDKMERVMKSIERCQFVHKESLDLVCVAKNLLWMKDILLLESITRKENPILDEENPLLLVYDEEVWELLLQLWDLKELIELDRIIFYNDMSLLKNSIVEGGVLFPEFVIGNQIEEFRSILEELSERMEQQWQRYKTEAQNYYSKHGEEVRKHIRERKPKILFVTSRFTTALQYHVRDCRSIAESMNLETELRIEKDRLHTEGSPVFYLKKIAEFKPDIIFILDHFRYEYRWMDELDELVWVSWAQDPLPGIFSKETVKRQKENDVVISCFSHWEKFEKLGYEERRLIRYPLVANHEIYRPYMLSDVERKKYACDVCMVCHACDADGYAKRFIKNFEEETRIFIEDLYQSYIRYVRVENDVFRTIEEYRLFVREFAKKFYEIEVSTNFLNFIAQDMWTNLGPRLYRGLTADWLLEAGYTNIKLWGNEWKNSEKYKPYAMGAAKNGETLSKILQASKIIIGNNVVGSGTSRVPETMLSGAFYMECYVPPEADMLGDGPLQEGKEIVFFKNKEDFQNKVKFYLENEEERMRMASIGRKKALEKLTYREFMKYVIEKLGKMFS